MSKSTKHQKVPVSVRALMQRLDRKLGKKDWPERLCSSKRGSRAWNNLGDFHVVSGNEVVNFHLTLADIEGMARKEGCLAPYEAVVAEE